MTHVAFEPNDRSGARAPDRSRGAYVWFFTKLLVVGGALYAGIYYVTDRFKIAYDAQPVPSLHQRYVLYDAHDRPLAAEMRLGDVIVFRLPEEKYPEGAPWPRDHWFTKRVFGLPGDVVEVNEQLTTVNGRGAAIGLALVERLGELQGDTVDEFVRTFTVPEEHFFPLGDTLRSFDGRYFGAIHQDQVLGRVVLSW